MNDIMNKAFVGKAAIVAKDLKGKVRIAFFLHLVKCPYKFAIIGKLKNIRFHGFPL
jgi:hypothetical protein